MQSGERKVLSNDKIIAKQFFRLLPVQVLLIVIPNLNGFISSLFATNKIGADAMSAIATYSPILQLLMSVGTMMLGGSQILCGKYMGRNEIERTQSIFSLDISFVLIVSLAASVLLGLCGSMDLLKFMNHDSAVRQLFNRYLIGCCLGIVPMMVGNQLSAFLSMEMQGNRSTIATGIFVILNLILTFLFLNVFHMDVMGIALAASIGYWAYLLIQMEYYLRGKSLLTFRLTKFRMSDLSEIIKIGIPGALISFYMTIRRSVLNSLILRYVGNEGLSAYGVADTFLGLFWAVPLGMAAVYRMLLSVSVGEEDRESLKVIVKTMLTRCLAVVTVMMVVLILLAEPFTNLYFHDSADIVYRLTVQAFQLLPIAMPLGLVCQTASNYGQVMEKQLMVHILSLIDGAASICLSALVLVPVFGMAGVYYAIIFNGIVTVIYPVVFSAIVNRHMPKNFDELLMLPDNFGVAEGDRMDISVDHIEDVVDTAEKVQSFCKTKGLDSRKANYAGLFIEEMAGNVIDHGFHKDKKKHSIDIRVAYKAGNMILRIKDDCIPFNPKERLSMSDPSQVEKNLGIRMVYTFAKDIQYQNILGLNALTVKL